MDDALKEELLALENRYWTALKERDSATAVSLSADPAVVVGAQGANELSREALGKLLSAAPYELETFSLQDFRPIAISDDVVAVTYKVNEELTVEGEKVKLEAFDSSVWAKRAGEWLCVIHTESIAGDPFGRR